MGVSLATLVDRLQQDVAARDGVPSAAQYERAVRDAVADYSRRRPSVRVTSLTIASGTADYALPEDFLFVIALEALWHPDGVLHSPAGLIPLAAGYEERFTIAGLTLTLHPTPAYSATRALRYAAGHVLDADDVYPAMTEGDARIALLKAAALCLRLQARAAAIAGEMVEYQIGDERVKRAPVAERLAAAADTAEAEYEMAVRQAIGPVGMRGGG